MSSLNVFAWSEPGIGKRRSEDALLVGDQVLQGRVGSTFRLSGNTALAAVADGLAGTPRPHVGSRVLLELLASTLSKRPVTDALRPSLEALHEQFQENGSLEAGRGSAATLAGIRAVNDRVQVFNAGDSRAYLIRDGFAKQLSRDHTELADMLESGEISADEARNAPSFYLEPSAFFMADPLHPPPRIEITSLTCRSGDVVLLCTDGILETMSDADLGRADLESIAGIESLTAEARRRGATDDISMVSIAFAA